MIGMVICSAAYFPIWSILGPSQLRTNLLKRLPPYPRPRECSDKQDERKPRYPKAGHRVQVAPKCPLTLRQSRPNDPCHPPTIWPPQIETRQYHHNCPTSRKLDQPTSHFTRKQTAVDVAHHFCNAATRFQHPEHFALRGNKHFSLGAIFIKPKRNHRSIAAMFGQPVTFKLCAGICAHRRLKLSARRYRVGIGQPAKIGFLPPFNLRLEQKDRTCDRQQQNKRHHE